MMPHNSKKICFCTTIGTSMLTFILPIAKKLHEVGGYDIAFICAPDPYLNRALPNYITFIPLNMNRGLDLMFVSRITQFVSIFRKEHFDIVQYTTPNAAFYASIAAKICKVPVRYYCQWGLRYVGYKGIKRKIFKFIEKITCKNSTYIQSASELNMQIAINEGFCPRNKINIVGHGGTIGVDTKIFRLDNKARWRNEIRKKYSIPDNAFVYGFVGRINKDKGCNELIEAFRSISETKSHAFLLIIGDIDTENGIRPELETYLHSTPNVVMTGRIENNVISKYYSALDILVHPTYREGFGMVIQEAGALKIPAITTKIPGASEVMVDGKSAIHITPKNLPELIEAMSLVEENMSLTERLGCNAYKRTVKYYERQTMLDYQARAYERLAKKDK